jgi:hypothetical protein
MTTMRKNTKAIILLVIIFLTTRTYALVVSGPFVAITALKAAVYVVSLLSLPVVGIIHTLKGTKNIIKKTIIALAILFVVSFGLFKLAEKYINVRYLIPRSSKRPVREAADFILATPQDQAEKQEDVLSPQAPPLYETTFYIPRVSIGFLVKTIVVSGGAALPFIYGVNKILGKKRPTKKLVKLALLESLAAGIVFTCVLITLDFLTSG